MARGSIDVRLWNYTSNTKLNEEMSQSWEKSSTDNLFLGFNKKHARDSDGNRVNAINPTGASGGPVFYTGDFKDPLNYLPTSQCHPLLEGILIEKSLASGALVAVRIAAVIECSRRFGILPR
jgi:hypothetical protein